MAKQKQKSLAKQLVDMLCALEDLRERINELRYSTEFRRQDIKLSFAVDFSEVFSYLHLTREAEADVQILGVSLDSQKVEQNVLQYRLGLTYLFDSIHPLYILPAHTQEMWSSFISKEADKKIPPADRAERLLEGFRSLGPESKLFLASLETRAQSEDLSQELLDFVKSSDFAPLCVDVSQFVSWYKSGPALKSLLHENVISPHIDKLLAKHQVHITELKEPSGAEIDDVVSMFPVKTRTLKPFATRIDARALLFLRNINQLLARDNARLILVTRDANLLQIAKAISVNSKSTWSEAERCVRGIETMFLELTLTSTRSEELKSKWILESELLLAKLHNQVRDRLAQIRHDGSGSQVSPLANLGKQVLKEAAQLWDQHINVKLSLASDSTTPLGKAFLEVSKHQLPVNVTQLSREYQILKNLLEYLSTEIYRTAATEDVQAVWDGLKIDLWRNQLLDIGLESLGELLDQTYTTSSQGGPTNLHSKRPFKMPPIRLVSQTYQDKLRALKSETGEKYNQVLFAIIKEVVTGFDEPEDLFFMAYLAGLLDNWLQALTLGEKCRKMISRLAASPVAAEIIPSEVDFFLSAIKMRLGRASADPVEALKFYLRAYQDIGRARAAVPDDQRYMMNEAAIALQYDEQNLCLWASSTEDMEYFSVQSRILSRADAIAQLKEALVLATTRNDTEFRIKILNNLIFAEVPATQPAVDLAESYIQQMDEALESATDEERQTWSGFVNHLNETKVMWKARHARDQKNMDILRECLAELKQIASDPELIQHERASFLSHVEQVNNWINELERSTSGELSQA